MMKLAVFCILAVMVLPVMSNQLEEVNGQMNLRGSMLDDPLSGAQLAVSALATETVTEEATVEEEQVEETETMEEEAVEEEDTEEEEETEEGEVAVIPTRKEEKRVAKSHCERWEERADYPAGVICALMEVQMDDKSDNEVFINDLRQSIIAMMPDGRRWNEKSFIASLARQTELGRLDRANNMFSVNPTYIIESAATESKGKEKERQPRSEKTPKGGRNERSAGRRNRYP